MTVFPVALALDGRRVLVVGGGAVAARKVAALLEAGARVTVVSPDLAPDFPSPIAHIARCFAAGDCADFALVFAATDSRAVNELVAADGREHGAWVNDASNPADSDFHTQAVVRRGPITVGLSTGGLSPVVSARLREVVEAALGPEWEELLALVAELGEPELSKRGAFWRGVLGSGALELLRDGKREEARGGVGAQLGFRPLKWRLGSLRLGVRLRGLIAVAALWEAPNAIAVSTSPRRRTPSRRLPSRHFSGRTIGELSHPTQTFTQSH